MQQVSNGSDSDMVEVTVLSWIDEDPSEFGGTSIGLGGDGFGGTQAAVTASGGVNGSGSVEGDGANQGGGQAEEEASEAVSGDRTSSSGDVIKVLGGGGGGDAEILGGGDVLSTGQEAVDKDGVAEEANGQKSKQPVPPSDRVLRSPDERRAKPAPSSLSDEEEHEATETNKKKRASKVCSAFVLPNGQ